MDVLRWQNFREELPIKKCITISMGAYDWYNETSNGTPSQPNGFLDNIKKITENSLNYLVTN
jgi:hypothetical protein